MRVRRALLASGALLTLAIWHAPLRAGDTPTEGVEFFEKKIRPILVENCYKCHGGDKQKGKLQLDSRAKLLKGGDSGPAVVPGRPEASLLIKAIRYSADGLRMPPKSRLTDAQIADLTAWVKMGAPWPEQGASTGRTRNDAFDLRERQKHWAWRPVTAQPPPRVQRTSWPQSPIDHFVLARLEAAGLAPAKPADKRTLLRRVSYDLIGLPPTPAEIDAFLADNSDNAFAKVVERLLASDHYGERSARHWLDLVRYAETCGHEYDPDLPEAYAYRDYVIRALNGDLPYDQFVREHIAGDLLPEPRRHKSEHFNESILATGFWFLGEAMHSPVDIRSDEADRLDNQIDVFAKTFLGLTVACARCHDHKFDAITTKDYYALAGYLESSRYQRAYINPPEKSLAALQQLQTLHGQCRAVAVPLVAEMLQERCASLTRDLMSSQRHKPLNVPIEHPLYPFSVLASPFQVSDIRPFAAKRQELAQQLKSAACAAVANNGRYEVFEDFQRDFLGRWFSTGDAFGTCVPQAPAVVLQLETPRLVAQVVGPGMAHSGVLSNDLQGVLRSQTFVINKKKILYHVSGRKCQIRLIIDGYQHIQDPIYGGLKFNVDAGEQFIWSVQDVSMWLGQRAYIEIIDDGAGSIAVDRILFSDDGPPNEPPNRLLMKLLEDAQLSVSDQFAHKFQELFRQIVEQWRSGTLATTVDCKERVALLNFMLQSDLFVPTAQVLAGRQEQRARLAELRTRYRQAEAALPAPGGALAMADGTAWNEHVFLRGNPKILGPEVPRRLLESLGGDHQPSPSRGSGRLDLARQLTEPANPLVARVLVNRIWQHHFGEGIVRSVDNFGVLGERPSHPELLDYLAHAFITNGWSIKKLHRLLVLSATYQMSSRAEDEAETRDPQNRLLHRMPIRRLEAETIRDAMLAVSGRLDPKMFGPSVPPYLTPHMAGRGRPASSGPLDGDGRRSIYLAVRRNFLTPLFLAFDYPIPFTTIGRRSVSNVPAQALALMNNPLVVQQAELWSQRILAETAAESRQRITRMYVGAFARPPTKTEIAEALEFLQAQCQKYGRPDDPQGWRDLAHVLFNVKEFIFLN